MRRIEIAGGTYAENLPQGEFAVLVGATVMRTHAGDIQTPLDEYPLYHRITNVRGFKIAGKGQNTGRIVECVNNGAWQLHPHLAHGVGSVIYDRDGHLNWIEPAPHQTSQGYRYVDPRNGNLVRGDATYGPFFGLNEYTDLSDDQDGGLLIGQANPDAGGPINGAIVRIAGQFRVVQPGYCTWIRANRTGSFVAIAMFTERLSDQNPVKGVLLLWMTLDELAALPLAQFRKPEPQPEPQPEPKPVPDNAPPAADLGEFGEYFMRLVAGTNAANYKTVIARIQPELWLFGVGAQMRSSGEPNSRLQLPHAGCRNVAPRPGNERELFLGVRQDTEEAWKSTVDTVWPPNAPTMWLLHGRLGPAYVPLETGGDQDDPGDSNPEPKPEPKPEPSSLEKKVDMLELLVRKVLQNQDSQFADALKDKGDLLTEIREVNRRAEMARTQKYRGRVKLNGEVTLDPFPQG